MPEHELTTQQVAFVDQYLINGYCGTKAAITAGYGRPGAGVRACNLLKKPKVQERLQAHLDAIGITRERVLHEMVTTAFDTDLADYQPLVDGSMTVAELRDSGVDTRQIVDIYQYCDPQGVITRRVKLRDATRLHDKLAQVLGLYKEVATEVHLSGSVGRNLDDGEIKALASYYDAKSKDDD